MSGPNESLKIFPCYKKRRELFIQLVIIQIPLKKEAIHKENGTNASPDKSFSHHRELIYIG